MIDHDAHRSVVRIFVLLLMFSATKVHGQLPSGAKNLGLANASVALVGIHSIGENAAGIAELETAVFSGIYHEYFIGSDTRSFASKFAIPTNFATLGIYGHQTYFENYYRKTSVGFTFAKQLLSSGLSAGISTNYHSIKLFDIKELNYVSLDIGAQYSIQQHAKIGLSISNLQQLLEEGADWSEPMEISLGAVYNFSYQVFLSGEFSHLIDNRTDFAMGVNYLPIRWLAFRGGVSLHPFMQYAGTGFIFKKLHVDIATSYHPQLGYSPQISVDYRF